MSEKPEDVKPLAAAFTLRSDDAALEHGLRPSSSDFAALHRRQKCIKCCGCSAATVLIVVMICLTLMLTIFHIKDPTIRLVSAEIINGLDDAPNGRLHLNNLTIIENVLIKNPNVGAFKFDNITTSVYYNGSVDVGEGRMPAGKIVGRKTAMMNVSVEVMVEKILEAGGFDERDLSSGSVDFDINTCTRMFGKIKVANLVRSVEVNLECRMNVVQDQSKNWKIGSAGKQCEYKHSGCPS